jgi:tRNA(fMet)-specific endonuclease VapC
MPKYMLDTNMCIYLIKHQPAQVAQRFAACMAGDVVMSAITYAELEYGVAASAKPARERRHLAALVDDIPVVAFDRGAAAAYGPIRHAASNRRSDRLDKLIAAHAVALGLTLVTNNERDFRSYPGIQIENWLNG